MKRKLKKWIKKLGIFTVIRLIFYALTPALTAIIVSHLNANPELALLSAYLGGSGASVLIYSLLARLGF